MNLPEVPDAIGRSFDINDIVYYVQSSKTGTKTILELKKATVMGQDYKSSTCPRLVVRDWHDFDQEDYPGESVRIRRPVSTHSLHNDQEISEILKTLSLTLGQDICNMALPQIITRPGFRDELILSLGTSSMLRMMLDDTFETLVVED